MPDLLKTIKNFGLSEFYFSLPVEYKADLATYSQYLVCQPQKVLSCSPGCDGCFMVENASQFLWATAANAIPDRKYEFAEEILIHALDLAEDTEDIAWIHANLAQVYYDNHKTSPEAGKKSMIHCRKLIELGYMKSWAQNLMEELAVFQI